MESLQKGVTWTSSPAFSDKLSRLADANMPSSEEYSESDCIGSSVLKPTLTLILMLGDIQFEWIQMSSKKIQFECIQVD